MKNSLLLLSVLITGFSATAQEDKGGVDYNKFSIEANAGIVKPTTPMANGYYTSRVSPLHVDLGVRYMFNTKFGLRAQVGYDKLENDDNSLPFNSKYMNVNLQGVANLGRIMNFEEWTKVLNLQAHTGIGYAQLKSDDYFQGTDNMMNFIVGLTGQVKLSNRIALNADFSMLNNIKQSYSFDGTIHNPDTRGFNGSTYNASVGIAVYLGKHNTHADWTFEEVQSDELAMLENRIGEVETMLNDTDQDGVPDYLDAENNSTSGVAVDSKGRMIDKNNNGVADELEKYVDQRIANSPSGAAAGSNGKAVETLINEGYISVFFNFNSTTPTADSSQNIAFILNYLKNNPTASADVVGYADEIGSSEVNKTISAKRAENVKNTLVEAGIAASRLNVVSAGEDTSVSKDSNNARKLVRRVIFLIK